MTDHKCTKVDPMADEHFQDLQRLAILLDTTPDIAEIMEAIGQLKANNLQSRASILRTLWLVLRHAYHDIGFRVPRSVMIQTDWSRAYIQRDEDPATGDIRLTAVERK